MTQRNMWRAGKLDPGRAELLEGIGMEWSPAVMPPPPLHPPSLISSAFHTKFISRKNTLLHPREKRQSLN